MSTEIEWTDETWNFLAGCSPVSEGCRNCYAAKEAIRLAGNPHPAIGGKYAGTAEMRGLGRARRAVFTGRVNFHAPALEKPLRVQKPRRWFVNSMSDLFHPEVPFEVVDRAFAVMALCPQHTFQILTKRPERMAEYLSAPDAPRRISRAAAEFQGLPMAMILWPLPNVWLGTSVENQAAADERIPKLALCPAAVRFLSCEPLLGPVDVRWWFHPEGDFYDGIPKRSEPRRPLLDWVIVGGESGPRARPMHPDWARSLRDQCQAAGVAFFFKQWGEYAPSTWQDPNATPRHGYISPTGAGEPLPSPGNGCGYGPAELEARGCACVDRVGKKAAGRRLDGREWSEYPALEPVP